MNLSPVRFPSGFVWAAAAIALGVLAFSIYAVHPICIRTPPNVRCDPIRTARAMPQGPYTSWFEGAIWVVEDSGTSVLVTQTNFDGDRMILPSVIHPPIVTLDRSRCHVCEVRSTG